MRGRTVFDPVKSHTPSRGPPQREQNPARISTRESKEVSDENLAELLELDTEGEILANKGLRQRVIDTIRKRMQLVGIHMQEQGYKEAVKDVVKEEELNRLKLEELLHKSQKVLFRTSSVFPFDFFPDEVCIDVNHVNVTTRMFFWSDRKHSISIKNIMDVFVDTSLLFATLKITDSSFVENTIDVHYLTKGSAQKARKIIQGLVVATKHGIDLTKIQDDKLLERIEELGTMQEQD